MVVASSDVHQNGQPFFTYRPATAKRQKAITTDSLAEYQFAGMLNLLLTAMQSGRLPYLKSCVECGKWIEARAKNSRFCSDHCNHKWHNGSPKYKAQTAERQKKLYWDRKKRDENAKKLTQVL
ncbi:MAG TPA: hypothetical protein VK638_15355 [Edaphobacter sp.]|nr:hypothetical protein [Edaphobacter sp.]